MANVQPVSRTRTVLLALGQVWLIVLGILASGLSGKLAAQVRGGPFTPQFLIQCGPLLLAIPLAWSIVALVLRASPATTDDTKRNAYRAGWVVAALLALVFVYGIISPWNQPVPVVVAGEE